MQLFENYRVQAALLKLASLWPVKYDAPYVPAPMPVIRKMLAFAEVGKNDIVYDLGCGDGRTVITAACEYGAQAVGIELDIFRYLWCQALVTLLGLRGRVKIIFGSFFAKDLSEASLVACYLGQETNQKIQAKFKEELQPNTRIVSYNFTFPEFTLIRQDKEAGLYLYNHGEINEQELDS